MTKRLIGFAALALVFVACGISPAKQLRATVATIDKTQSRAHSFTYADNSLDGSQKIEVDGRVADDFQYAGEVKLNGRPLYDMIVSDDAVALRLVDRNATQHIINFATAEDAVTGKALANGQWVVDFTAAPALRVVATTPNPKAGSGTTAALAADQNAVGNDPFFDGADALHYAERNIGSGTGVTEFNPEDVQYNPADDPWASDAKLSLRNKGIIRYDLGQPPLPIHAARGQQQALPTVSSFRKMAMYVKGNRTVMVREEISIRDRKEFRRAEEGRAAKYYLQLRDAALAGDVGSSFRERRMTYVVSPFTGGPIAIPADAVHGVLKDVIGDQGLKTLFKFKIIQRANGTDILPGLPNTNAGGSPAASGSPASSAAPSATP